ncbi:pyridoxal phosphate-dependent transferase [Roridomyces roridus]|uniref:Pyridoxal phosphate-dependent transferase n=1 Tax=Roridomyces roridus TaxID=1738132 RepID=A0AAD7BMJ3_9AGAR|nr:pyridoxal phosphate-dependent transferase [Roridomyces roridus]
MSSLTRKLESVLQSRGPHGLMRIPPPSYSGSDGTNATLDFSLNDYLSLSESTELRGLFLDRIQTAPSLFGSGSSRVIVNPKPLADLEQRLARFFDAPDVLIFGSGHDANVAFFRHVPQPGDIVLYDQYIHASIHDGMRSGRAQLVSFEHNDSVDLRQKLKGIVEGDAGVGEGTTSVFLAVESIYSMDGSIAPLKLFVDALDEELPKGNGHFIVDEAHATGVYGPQGRGIVAAYGLESRCLARLHTFGKSLASTGAVLLTTPLIREYLASHARVFIFTTAPSHSTVISIDCAFDMLESSVGTEGATHLLDLCAYLTQLLLLKLADVPPHILSLLPHFHRPLSPDVHTLPETTLPTPIIPLITPRAAELSAFLATRGIRTPYVIFPVVPRDKARVRVCVNANKTREDIEMLADAVGDWAREMVKGDSNIGTKL